MLYNSVITAQTQSTILPWFPWSSIGIISALNVCIVGQFESRVPRLTLLFLSFIAFQIPFSFNVFDNFSLNNIGSNRQKLQKMRILPEHGCNVKDFADKSEDLSEGEDDDKDDKFPRVT